MPKIKLSGQVMDEIYNEAIGIIPNGGRFVANTYLSNPEKRATPKQAFEKTMEQMRHMVRGTQQDFLKAATGNYLQRHYGFPVTDMKAYAFQPGRDSITIRPMNEQAGIPFNGWLNRLGFGRGQTTLSQVGDIRGYHPIAPDELMSRLDEHNKWLSDRQQILSSAKELFKLDDAQLAEFMKSMPAARADFSGCEIQNMDFRGQNLEGVSFQNARLENCAFRHAQGANFSGATMERCRFEQGQLSFIDFQQSRQNDVRFDSCQMQEVNFNHADMKDVTFSGCDLRGAHFEGIDLNKLHFEQPEPAPKQEQEHSNQPEPVQAQNLEHTQTQGQAPTGTPIHIEVEPPGMNTQTMQ